MDYLLNSEREKEWYLVNGIVLNLIINGLPSKLHNINQRTDYGWGFKPYYKWITF